MCVCMCACMRVCVCEWGGGGEEEEERKVRDEETTSVSEQNLLHSLQSVARLVHGWHRLPLLKISSDDTSLHQIFISASLVSMTTTCLLQKALRVTAEVELCVHLWLEGGGQLSCESGKWSKYP